MKLFIITSVCLFASFLSCQKKCCDNEVVDNLIQNNEDSIFSDTSVVIIGEIYQRADFSYAYNEDFELSYYVKYTINSDDILG